MRRSVSSLPSSAAISIAPQGVTSFPAIAMRAGRDYGKLTGESFYEVLTLVRFGRFDEVLAVTND